MRYGNWWIRQKQKNQNVQTHISCSIQTWERLLYLLQAFLMWVHQTWKEENIFLIKPCAVFLIQCLLQLDDMTSTDYWNFFETMPPETVSDEVFAPQFPAKLDPTPLHSTHYPPTPPHIPNKSLPQPPTSVPSPTRSFFTCFKSFILLLWNFFQLYIFWIQYIKS